MRTTLRAALVGAAVLPLAAITPGLAFAGEAGPAHSGHSEDAGDHHKGHQHKDQHKSKKHHSRDCGCHTPPAPPRGGGLPVPTPPALDPTALLGLLNPAAPAPVEEPTRF